MSLKNSLVETFSNNFPKLINNSSSLNSVNHKCDGVCISDINWYRCCNFNFPFSLVSVSVEKIGVLVCIVCQTPHSIIFPTPQILPNIFRSVFKSCNELSTFSLVASQSQMLIFDNSIPTERNKIKHKTPSTHCGPIFIS